MLHLVPSFPAFFKENVQLNLNHETNVRQGKVPKDSKLEKCFVDFCKDSVSRLFPRVTDLPMMAF